MTDDYCIECPSCGQCTFVLMQTAIPIKFWWECENLRCGYKTARRDTFNVAVDDIREDEDDE